VCDQSGRQRPVALQPPSEALTKWQLTLVTGGGGGDTTPPSTPATRAPPQQPRTACRWPGTRATDDVGVTGYDVYNGQTLATSVAVPAPRWAACPGHRLHLHRQGPGRGRKRFGGQRSGVRADPAGRRCGRTFSNGTDFPIQDFQQVRSRSRSADRAGIRAADGRGDDPAHLRGGSRHHPVRPRTAAATRSSTAALQLHAGRGPKTYTVTNVSSRPAAGGCCG